MLIKPSIVIFFLAAENAFAIPTDVRVGTIQQAHKRWWPSPKARDANVIPPKSSSVGPTLGNAVGIVFGKTWSYGDRNGENEPKGNDGSSWWSKSPWSKSSEQDGDHKTIYIPYATNAPPAGYYGPGGQFIPYNPNQNQAGASYQPQNGPASPWSQAGQSSPPSYPINTPGAAVSAAPRWPSAPIVPKTPEDSPQDEDSSEEDSDEDVGWWQWLTGSPKAPQVVPASQSQIPTGYFNPSPWPSVASPTSAVISPVPEPTWAAENIPSATESAPAFETSFASYASSVPTAAVNSWQPAVLGSAAPTPGSPTQLIPASNGPAPALPTGALPTQTASVPAVPVSSDELEAMEESLQVVKAPKLKGIMKPDRPSWVGYECYECASLSCKVVDYVADVASVEVQCLTDGESARGNSTWVKPVGRECILPAEIFQKDAWIGARGSQC